MHGGRTAALGVLLLLGSCASESPYRDPSEPVTIEDLQPLPSEVNRGNARLLVRRCLQAHRRGASLPDDQFGYVFHEAGFVQLLHHRPQDRAQERLTRSFVDYASIASVSGEPYFDFQFLKERFRITLKGAFHKWEGPFYPTQALPDIGREPVTVAVDSLTLSLDDAVVAKRLADSLSLLSGR